MSATRDEWLEARRSGIGGSDAAIACGLHPQVSALELYYDKTGESPLARVDTERMQMGRALEDAIADVYAERFGVKLRRHAMKRHRTFPWMIGNPDRLIEGARIGLEIKNVDAFVHRFGDWGEPDTDEIPEPYLMQCLHYMIVFGFEEWHVGALIGGNTLKRYIVRRDAELESMLLDAEREFWQRVERHDPPKVDYGRADTIALLKRLYPGTNGETIDLPDDVTYWHRVRVEADELAKRYTRAADDAKAHILGVMGDASVGRLAGGGEYRRKIVNRAGFTVEPTSYVDCRFTDQGKTR